MDHGRIRLHVERSVIWHFGVCLRLLETAGVGIWLDSGGSVARLYRNIILISYLWNLMGATSRPLWLSLFRIHGVCRHVSLLNNAQRTIKSDPVL